MADPVVIYDVYNPPPDDGLICVPEEDMAKQEFKDECDINRIMARAVRQGVLPVPGNRIGRYGDFSEVGDYQNALERVEHARVQFGALPSKVRDRFGNDPGRFLAWVMDKANLEEANDLGLLSEESSRRVVAAREAKAAAAAAAAVPPVVSK